jgi:hypothetical protein
VVKRIVKTAFWNVLADFAMSAVVPMTARNGLLTNQPFFTWPVVVVRGSGLRGAVLGCLVHVRVCACFVLCTGLLHPACMCALRRYSLRCH